MHNYLVSYLCKYSSYHRNFINFYVAYCLHYRMYLFTLIWMITLALDSIPPVSCNHSDKIKFVAIANSFASSNSVSTITSIKFPSSNRALRHCTDIGHVLVDYNETKQIFSVFHYPVISVLMDIFQ